MMKKRILACLFAGLLLVSMFAACAKTSEGGPAAETPSETGGDTTTEPSQTPSETETEPSETPSTDTTTPPADATTPPADTTTPSTGTTKPTTGTTTPTTGTTKPTTGTTTPTTGTTKPSTGTTTPTTGTTKPSTGTTTPTTGTTKPTTGTTTPTTGTTTPTTGTTTSGTSSKTSIPKTFPVVKQDPSYTVVNFWHAMTGRYGPLTDNIANWYNATLGKQNKTYVKTIFQGAYDDITVKIQATLQSGNLKDLPDLVQLSSQGAFSVKDSTHIVYMEDMMKADKTFTIGNKLNKNAMWACSYKGKQLGLPFSNSMIVMHYNVTAFKAVGLDPDNPPKTLAEYASAASKLVIKGTGKKPTRYGATNKINAYHLSTWIPRQLDGQTSYQFDNEDGRAGVPKTYAAGSNGTLKATLTAWKTVLDTGVVDYNTTAPRANFETGFTAMYMDSMVQYDTIEGTFAGMKDKSKIFEHRMYRIPQVSANDTIYEAIGGSAVYMFDKGDAKKKAATWSFVKFLGDVNVSAYWYIQSGYYPLNSDAISTDYVQSALKATPNKKVLLTIRSDSAKGYKYQEPWMPSYSVYSNLVGDQTSLLAAGKQTVDQTVANITKKANALLKVYWDSNS